MALETPYSSQQEADTAWANYTGSSDGSGSGDGGDTPGADDGSSALAGTVAAPETIAQGEAFDAGGRVENKTGNTVSGVVYLALDVDGWVALARQDIDLQVGDQADLGYQVPRGATSDVPAGDTSIGLVFDSGDSQTSGVVDTKPITVEEGQAGDGTQGRDGSGGDSQWGEAQHVQELPYGWQLYAQEHQSRDEVRYIIAGKNENGEVIYLAKDGTVVRSPEFYSTAEEVQAALEAYAQRMENGEVPPENQADPSQSRPSPGQVTQDANAQESGATGFLSPILGPSGQGFGGSHVIVAAVVFGGVYYLWQRRGTLSRRQAYIALAVTGGVLTSHAMGVP